MNLSYDTIRELDKLGFKIIPGKTFHIDTFLKWMEEEHKVYFEIIPPEKKRGEWRVNLFEYLYEDKNIIKESRGSSKTKAIEDGINNLIHLVKSRKLFASEWID